jgi:hypothetical protein
VYVVVVLVEFKFGLARLVSGVRSLSYSIVVVMVNNPDPNDLPVPSVPDPADDAFDEGITTTHQFAIVGSVLSTLRRLIEFWWYGLDIFVYVVVVLVAFKFGLARLVSGVGSLSYSIVVVVVVLCFSRFGEGWL